jgi:hypothetical protein
MAVSRILSWTIIYLIPRFAGRPSTNSPPKRSFQFRWCDIPEDLYRTGCPPSVLSCTAWGFSCRLAYAGRGELLPRLFTLTCLQERTVVLSKNRRCLFCDTFRRCSLSTTTPTYSTWHAAVWCSDFPPANLAIHQRSSAIDTDSSTFRSKCIGSDYRPSAPMLTTLKWAPSSDKRRRNGHELLLST